MCTETSGHSLMSFLLRQCSPCFLRQGLSLGPQSHLLDQIGWLESPQGFSCRLAPRAGLLYTSFHVGAEGRTRILMLVWQVTN